DHGRHRRRGPPRPPRPRRLPRQRRRRGGIRLNGGLLSVRGLSVSYGPIGAVRNVSLKVGEGEIVALLGPNGAGKTSVLRGITALVRPVAGRVRMAGQRVDDP